MNCLPCLLSESVATGRNKSYSSVFLQIIYLCSSVSCRFCSFILFISIQYTARRETVEKSFCLKRGREHPLFSLTARHIKWIFSSICWFKTNSHAYTQYTHYQSLSLWSRKRDNFDEELYNHEGLEGELGRRCVTDLVNISKSPFKELRVISAPHRSS